MATMSLPAYASVISLSGASPSLTLPASHSVSRSLAKGKSKTPAKCKCIVYDDNSSFEDAENDNPSLDSEVKRRSSRIASKGCRKKTPVIENLDSEEGPKNMGGPDGDADNDNMSRDPIVPTTASVVDITTPERKTQEPTEDMTPMDIDTMGFMGVEIPNNNTLDPGN